MPPRGYDDTVSYPGAIFDRNPVPEVDNLIGHLYQHGVDYQEIPEILGQKPVENLDLDMEPRVAEKDEELWIEQDYWWEVSSQLSDDSEPEKFYKFEVDEVGENHSYSTADYLSDCVPGSLSGVLSIKGAFKSPWVRMREFKQREEVESYFRDKGIENVRLVESLE